MAEIDLEQVKKFIELIKGTDIEELYWEKEGTKVAFKRGSEGQPEMKTTSAGIKEDTSLPKEGAHLEEGRPKSEGKKVIPIKSPMVGTFYRSLPDRPPLVMKEDHVSVGEKVAVIEAMKIMKDVVSNVRGKIVKILVENATPVEYGQDLFLVETGDADSNR